MVTMYFQGKPYGSVPETTDVIGEIAKLNLELEFRDENGNTLGRYVPAVQYPVPWDPTVTKEQLDKECAERKGMKLEDFWKKIGAK